MTDEYFFTSCFIFNRSPGGSPRKSGDSDSGASGNPRTQLAEHLPVIADIGGMFADLVSRVPGMENFLTAMKRPLRVATMCSGTESPLLALDKIGDATEKLYGTRLAVDHVFSCEIEPFKQAYIERNFAPPILFRDIRELGGDQATTAYGAKINVPHDVDMLVAGTSCVDYSNLNNERKGLEAQGESGQTFRGMMNWIRKSQPPIIILENVCNAPWDQVQKKFEDEGYHARFMRVDTKRFYIPHTRTRVYLFACKASDASLVEAWKGMVKSLERPASATLEAFLFDADDPRVHEGRRMLARPGEDSTRANTDWGRCESRHQRARLEEGLGQRRPFTHWDGGCTLPDFAWNDWGKAQTDRVLDLMDIDYLRLAQLDIDSMHKTLVWNLSQNVDRTTGSVAPGICPCLTPSMVPFVTNRGGPLVGIEALSLQGIPVDDLLLTRESENQMSDLAGNAMTTTVVGACMLAAMTLMTDNLAAKKHKTARRALLLDDDSKESSQTMQGSLTVVQAAAAKKTEVVGQDKLVKRPLDLGMKPVGMKELLSKANRSARLCVCEGETGTTDADSLVICRDCSHTCCIKCCGRPEHNYEKHVVDRILPEDFKEDLKNSLPMHMKLDVSSAKFTKPKELLGKVWDDWMDAIKAIGEADFLFRGMKRTNVWRVYYSCASEDKVRLELRIAPNAAEWLIFVDPSIKKGKPEEFHERPLMRMLLDKSAKSVLDGTWEFFSPEYAAVPVILEGKGELEDSWQIKLGMLTNSKLNGDVNWPEERWTQYEVKLKDPKNATEFDRSITGTYQLYDKCDAAQSSLHKRIGGPQNGREMYFFMDPRRNQKGEFDYFVFADNHRRLMYGEDRMETAHLDFRNLGQPPSGDRFRPSDKKVVEHMAHTFGKWTALPQKVALMPAVVQNAVVLTPPVNAVPTQGEDSCSKAVAIMRCSVPLSSVDVDLWPENGYTTVRLDKSHATFQRLEWFTSRMELPKVVEKWNQLSDDHALSCDKFACSRCAPTPPTLLWSRQVGSQKIQAREDPLQASKYEQALKCRPEPFVVQWTREKTTGNLMIAGNPATLVHRALALVAPSGVRGIESKAPHMSWRIVRHDDRPMDNFGEFELKSNRHDKQVAQPPNWSKKYPLRPEQLRSLGWMVQQEINETPFVEEEICEKLLPALGLRMDGKAEVSKVIRGGIVADQVGYGKTAISIGVILANQLKFPTPKQAKVDAPVKAIPTKATLVIAPSQLLRQWPREVEKFSARGSLNTVVLKTMSDLNSLTAREVMEADVVIVATTLFRSSLYFERLAQLAGRPSLPDPKSSSQARHFTSVYKDTVASLEDQVMRLTDKKLGVAEVAKHTPTKKTPTKKTPMKSPIRASARNTPRKSYAEDDSMETDDEISDWDDDESLDGSESEEFVKEKSTPKRKRIVKQRSMEIDADGNKDHWGLESAQAEYDWRDIKSVPVELFHWRRVIVDEFTYLKPSDKAVVMGLQSESRWCLSGTPPVGDFADIKGTAALLGINLGSDEVPRYNKSEITKVETFQFFKEKPTQQWHKRRWEVAQGFLNRYMRQNIAEIDEIKFKEDVCDVQLRPAERAIYLELDHYLQSMDMKAKKKKRGASESDRDARLAAVLGNSSSAEEALLKRVAHFELDDEAGTALRTCQDIVNVRKTQQEDCLKEFGEAILKARAMLSQMSQMPDFTPEDNPFIRWENGVQGEGIGDPTASELLKGVVKAVEGEPSSTMDSGKSVSMKKTKTASLDDKLWELREHTHGLRKLQKELVGRVRSLRFFQSVRDLQQAKMDDSVKCEACSKKFAKSKSGVLSTCGHIGCVTCLKVNAENQECGVKNCDCATRDTSVVTAVSLGTEASADSKSIKTDGGVGVHGSKIIDIVAHIKSIPDDERILVFVQFPDLMQQVSSALNEAGIKTLKLKGSVHQQTGALDEFQKENLKKDDARVLLLLSRDESASGANLTTANHAIFVHPLLTNTAQEYIASETQAIGRIRRYGQQREVRIWRFIARDSVDSEILSQRAAGLMQN
ncbi:predicted protein [Ostreococcus lucimarinus CCE9901]|uniref:Helicase C-terminal domain-containing protein n=1 Tax=Ostreococcus lucimarinus (strain CCE9901) TaxID=436017 RepID=A4RWU3_OSTLU|nr:predicted protein [Ostreococcus lucimarinus CCE9901]ABO95686.1 predicted protein [Ostreococcus lucimarinus CCE9901]|eukprot:XP_001417393.1 predicted protein [Ostreococcus lucimarinus CCE9901]